MISRRGARRGFLRSHHVAYGSAVRLGWRNGILWEPAVYECRVGVDSGVETLSGGRRPADAKTTFAKLAGFSDHQRLGIAGRS
jgi:hypothetical protein